MGREPTRHPDDFPANSVGDRRGVVEDDGRGHNHVERSVGEWQAFAAAQDQCDVAPASQEVTSLLHQGPAEVNARHGDVEPAQEFAEQLAVSAADFEDRGGPIVCQSFGEPFRA